MQWQSRILPVSLALLIAIITTSFSALFNVEASILIILFLICFASSYFLIATALEFLVFREINEIYLSFEKIKKKDFKLTRRRLSTLTASPLQQLNEELYEYATKKQAEIDYLTQLEAFRREFLADVSHELKTPIFAAQGFIHTLIDGAVEDPEVRDKFLQKAAKSLEGLDHLVQDLITLSQMEAGIIKMHFQETNLNLILEEVFEQLEEKAIERNIAFVIDERTSPECIVWADRNRIRQVLTNLIENGIKYGKDGGFVKVWLLQTKEHCVIEVEDNGTGIPKKHLTRIFERFYRVEKSRSKEKGGSGLGLAIVKQIIDAHEGSIEVESKVDKGSTFRVTLKRFPNQLSENIPTPQNEFANQL